MKNSLFGLIFLIILFSISIQADKVDLELQKKVAVEYFEKLTQGDMDAANELITVPFNLDMKKVLNTKEEVYEFHKQMLEKKGKRAVPEYKVGYTRDELTLDSKVFPTYTAFLFEIMGKIKLYIYITNTKDPKVMGFTD